MLVLPPKTQLPASGLAPHDEDEYSIVVKCTMITTIGDREYRISAGDTSFIPFGEAHAVYNPGDEICQLPGACQTAMRGLEGFLLQMKGRGQRWKH